MESADLATNTVEAEASRSKTQSAAAGFALLVAALSALFYYKWSAAWVAVDATTTTGKLTIKPSTILEGGALLSTLHYFGRVWPALVYGIVIGAVVRAAVPAS